MPRLLRDIVLFVAGLLVLAHEVVFTPRLVVVMAAMTLLGFPAFLRGEDISALAARIRPAPHYKPEEGPEEPTMYGLVCP